MTWSVNARSVEPSADPPGWSPGQRIGSPKRTVTGRNSRGSFAPIGWTYAVPSWATGMTGAPHCIASLATPVCPLYSRPSGDLVPSG